MNKYLILGMVSLVMLFYHDGHAQSLPWLSGTPPPKLAKKFRPSGMQHYMTYRDRGTEKLILWYRYGETVNESEYRSQTITDAPEIYVYAPDGREKKFDFSNGENGLALTYNFDEEGYHNIFIIEKWVQDSVLRIHVSKAERLSHKCQNGHKKVREKVQVRSFDQMPIDIVRNRYRGGETLHLIHESGDLLSFGVSVDGKAVENARIKLSTHENWEKTAITDKNGEVSFQLIADYFSKWKEFQKKKTYHFLLKASFEEPRIGVYKGESFNKVMYTSTFAGDYIPSRTWYESNVWAIFIFFISLLIFSLAIYIYRWKFKRPY